MGGKKHNSRGQDFTLLKKLDQKRELKIVSLLKLSQS
jgi:hypothetical protein